LTLVRDNRLQAPVKNQALVFDGLQIDPSVGELVASGSRMTIRLAPPGRTSNSATGVV
jgi:hypothetical protein